MDTKSPLSPRSKRPQGFFFPSHYERSDAMGQAESTNSQSSHSMPTPASPASTTKPRFAWPGRRKKSEDFSKTLAGMQAPSPSPTIGTSSGSSTAVSTPAASSAAPLVCSVAASPSPGLPSRDQQPSLTRIDTINSVADSNDSMHTHDLSRPPSRASVKKHFVSSTLQALKGRLNASQASIRSPDTATPPPPLPLPLPLPPKPTVTDGSSSVSASKRPSTDTASAAIKPAPSAGEMPHSHKPAALVPAPSTTPAPVSSPAPASVSVSVSTTAPAPPPADAEDAVSSPQRRERRDGPGHETQALKDGTEDWRKSDSTLRTVRLVGSRTPRPLSLAESTNSGHTVLPSATSPSANIVATKRLSALMMDADFGLPEVDSEEESDIDESISLSAFSSFSDVRHTPASVPQHQEQTASADDIPVLSPPRESSRRRSLSIRIGRFSGHKGRVDKSGHQSGSESETHSSISTNDLRTANSSTTSITTGSSPSTKDCAASEHRPSVEIASTSSVGSNMSDIHKRYQGVRKLEPWVSAPQATESQTSLSTSTSASSNSNSREHAPTLAQSPPSSFHGAHPTMRPAHQRNRLQSIQAKGFRQTAVSLASGLAPAAGFAKKAADRLGRALGGSVTSFDTPPPGPSHSHSHSPSASSPSLFGMIGSSSSLQPPQPPALKDQRKNSAPSPRTKRGMKRPGHGGGASGSWSLGSGSNSQSDTDGPSGAELGRCVRGPIQPGARGYVFGRELVDCVQDTAIEGELSAQSEAVHLEGRRLPALVVRCAQHIVKWGVQEEGLFRISGRATHVAKLRAEFDSGADYDMRDCGPGELDPHAVSSIFKAYLRELPEPLLTRHLMPYFEAALTAENSLVKAEAADAAAQRKSNDGDHPHAHHAGANGLPSSPRSGLSVRKAPSLSTFAVPTLAPRAASESLISAFTTLIARLPQENRDLLRTLTELISVTARCAKETKMPLSNLLLVFCPSLAMSPPLLRVLCEGEGIWDGVPAARERGAALIDEDEVLDIRAPSPVESTDEKEEDVDISAVEDEREGLHAQKTIRRAPRTPVSEESKDNSSDSGAEKQKATPAKLAISSPVSPITSSAGGDSKHSSYLTNPYSPPGLTNSSRESLVTPPSSTLDSPAHLNAPSSVPPLSLSSNNSKPSDLLARRAARAAAAVPFPNAEAEETSVGEGATDEKPLRLRRASSLRVSTTSNADLKLLGEPSPPVSAGSLGRRKSKSSFHSLLPKRSLSSLLGLSQQQAQVQTPLRREYLQGNTGANASDSADANANATAPAHDRIVDDREDSDRENDSRKQSQSQPPRSRTPLPVLTLPTLTSPLMPAFEIARDDSTSASPSALNSAGSSASAWVSASVVRNDSRRNGRVPLGPRQPNVQTHAHSPSSYTPIKTHPQLSIYSASSKPLSPISRPCATEAITRGSSGSSGVSGASGTSDLVFYTPPTTARQLAPSGSLASTVSASSVSSGSYSFLDVCINADGDEEGDDWARSVLRAAASGEV